MPHGEHRRCRARVFSTRRGRAPASDIRVILFDVGGVLVEVTGIAVILDWLEQRMTAEDVARLWFDSPAVRAFETGRIEPVEFATRLLGELRLDMTPERFLDAFVTWPARLYPGALDLVARIPPSYRRALQSLQCTPSQVLFLDDSAVNIEAARKLGLHVVRVRGAEEAERALVHAGVVTNAASPRRSPDGA